MAKTELIESLNKTLGELVVFKGKELISRGEWGEINFEDIRTDVETVCNLISVL